MSERPSVGVGAVAVDDGRILLVRRGHEPHEGRWTLPGGGLHFGEEIDAALRREVLEETGLEVEVKGLAGVVEWIDPGAALHFVILDYFVEVASGDLRAGDDAVDVRWVPLDEIDALETTPRLVASLGRFGVL